MVIQKCYMYYNDESIILFRNSKNISVFLSKKAGGVGYKYPMSPTKFTYKGVI